MARNVLLADGTLVEGVPDDVTDDMVKARFGGSPAPAPAPVPKAPVNVPPIDVDPTSDMNWGDRAITAMGQGAERLYRGARNLLPGQSDTTEELENDKLYAKYREQLNRGGAATIGEIVGETAPAMALGGPLVSGAGKVISAVGGKILPKTMDAARKVGDVGGKFFNLKNAGRAAAEAGLQGYVVNPGENESRLGNAATSAALGGGIIGVPAVVGASARAAKNLVRPTEQAATRAAAKILERTLGREAAEAVVTDIKNGVPVPSGYEDLLTTAGLVDNASLGKLERGSRSNYPELFEPKDTTILNKAWDDIQASTRDADLLPALADEPGKIMGEGKRILNEIPLSQASRDRVTLAAQELLDTAESRHRPEVANAIKNVITGIQHPNATAQDYAQAVWALSQNRDLPGKSAAVAKLKNILQREADYKSAGEFTNMQMGYGGAMDAVAQAEAQQGIRRAFIDPEGVPQGPRHYDGIMGANPTPGMNLTEAKLRQVMTSKGISPEGQDLLGGMARGAEPGANGQAFGLNQVADMLRRREVYRPQVSPGTSKLDEGTAEGMTTAIVNSTPSWRLRGFIGGIFGGANRAAEEQIAKALADPQKFVTMIEAKHAKRIPLTDDEIVAWKAIQMGAQGSGTYHVGD